MKEYIRMLSLPPALLALIASTIVTASPDPVLPLDLPAHVKYYPEDAPLRKRGLLAMDKMQTSTPTGVYRMSDDPDQMFFLDYWQFEEEDGPRSLLARRALPAQYANSTSDSNLLPPLLVHTDSLAQSPFDNRLSVFARGLLKRYTCPSGTSPCSALNRPYSCCGNDETCVLVPDTGLGDVGCCPQGQTCSTMVNQCDTSAGYKACPGFSGGGCCIPNFDCSGLGCAINTTSTITTTAPTVTVTSCPASYTSCPASLGGGCCQTGAGCGTGRTCLTSTTTSASQTPSTTITTTPSATAAGVPARPISSSDTNTAVEPSTTTVGTEIIAVCPTNYYFCSAYFRPGCCRIGRDCSLTNCPSATSSQTIVSNGATIVIPAGNLQGGSTYLTTALITGARAAVATTLGLGQCQSGWQSCAQSIGGGCCPPNFNCDTVCSGVGGGYTGVVSRVAPGAAAQLHPGKLLGCAISLFFLFGSMIVWL